MQESVNFCWKIEVQVHMELTEGEWVGIRELTEGVWASYLFDNKSGVVGNLK